MRYMLGGDYLGAVRSTVFAAWLSMYRVMGAMVMPGTAVTGEQRAAMATLTVLFPAAGLLLAALLGSLA
ncbi:hypothetical protein ACFQ78_39380 [Streptomyces sp. NPDC056519]|uniref:hypothetical protein n=1 Tax=Streptomyces sp. NPDC056519 TaxID=3345849 RepID=UPI0036A4C9CD